MKQFFTILTLALFSLTMQAQTVDEVIAGYIEVSGGDDLKNMKSLSMDIKQAAQGMEFKGKVYQMEGGLSMVHLDLQGNDFYQNVFDGETLWSTNYINMQPEKSDSETLENYKKNGAKDFPDAFIDYTGKGYYVELVGSEEIDGVDTYKVKLTKVPTIENGEEKENIEYHYFDKDSYVRIASESEQDMGQGPMTVRTIYSDYEEIDGLAFPMTMTAYVDGNEMYSMVISNVKVNPEIDITMFAFPEK